MKKNLKQSGFSAIEILFFVIIIAIIAAIAVPKMIESKRQADEAKSVQTRHAADEASAVLTLRTIHRANSIFQLNGNGKFTNLSQLSRAELLDATFADENFNKHGYSFSLIVTASGDGFCAAAMPTDAESRVFVINETGEIYASSDNRQTAPVCDDGILNTNGAEPL